MTFFITQASKCAAMRSNFLKTRSYTPQGNIPKARAAYSHFLSLWTPS